MINVGIHLQLGRKVSNKAYSIDGKVNWVEILNTQDIIDEVKIFFKTKEQAEDVARARFMGKKPQSLKRN